MSHTAPPLACTLPALDRPRREPAARTLAARCTDAVLRPDAARLAFVGVPRAELDAFLADETRCCPFLGFAVAEADGVLELTVSAPHEAHALLAGLVAALAGGAPLPGRALRP